MYILCKKEPLQILNRAGMLIEGCLAGRLSHVTTSWNAEGKIMSKHRESEASVNLFCQAFLAVLQKRRIPFNAFHRTTII